MMHTEDLHNDIIIAQANLVSLTWVSTCKRDEGTSLTRSWPPSLDEIKL